MYAPESYSIISKGIRLTLRCERQPGFVYLIHFEQKFKHAAHYLGSTINLEARLQLHRAGSGARLMEVIAEHGIGWHVSKIWQTESPAAARELEAKLKRQHHDGRLCPECKHMPADPLASLMAGHWPMHVFTQPGKRKPMGPLDAPRFVRYTACVN